jgi:hypothetical protein
MFKKMKKRFLYAMLVVFACINNACNDGLSVNQVYFFELHTLPVPKRIKQGETVEIRCQIVKNGYYSGTTYSIRFFQVDGKGELRLDDGRRLTPNDLFLLRKDTFRLYYTSHCADTQVIDVYIEDSAGQVIKKSFSFASETEKKEEKEE